MFWGSKGPKLLRNALSGPQIHALDSILPTVNTESGLKGFFTVHVGVNIQSGVSPSDKINILESPKTEFFQKPVLMSQMTETSFLFLTVKLIKMTLLPHQSLFSAVKLASKYPSPTPETSLWQISADMHKTGPHYGNVSVFVR